MKQNWNAGDVFSIVASEQALAKGTVLLRPDDMRSQALVGISVLDAKIDQQTNENDFIAVLFITNENLNSGRWPILDRIEPIDISTYVDLAEIRKNGWIGVRVIGGGIVEEFAEACIGELPWDSYADPEYFSKLMLPSAQKPIWAFNGK